MADINAFLAPVLSETLTDKQKISKIGNLLSKMRNEGVITNTGTRTQPRWELSYEWDEAAPLQGQKIKESDVVGNDDPSTEA